MKVERLEISQLKLDPNNARTHDKANLHAIAGSLTQFGQRKPIVISQDNTVVAGNGTLTAAQTLGWTDIEAVRVPADWNSDRIKAFALADNRTAELADWDSIRLADQLIYLEIAEFDVSTMGFKAQLVELPSDLLDSQVEPRLDQRAAITCPNCSCEFRKTATGFEIV